MAKKSSGNGLYEVVWPSGERKQASRPLAKRLDTLKEKQSRNFGTFFSSATRFLPFSKRASVSDFPA